MAETPVPQPMPDPPRVSIVIVTRNQSAALRRCLESLAKSSIAAQTQTVVVDNGSTDGSNVIQDDFEGLVYLKLPKNFGWTKAANIGLRSTQADSILFLDPRVELDPGAVEALASVVTAESEAAATCAALRTPEGKLAPLLRKLPSPQNMEPAFFAPDGISETPQPVEFPGAFALLIRKPFLKGMNFLDERYGEQWSDAEIAVQVRRAGLKILMRPDAGGIFHAADAPPALDAALLQADFEQGAATYLAKHFGGGTGRRITAALGALGTFKLGLFSNLLSGQKVDGSQE